MDMLNNLFAQEGSGGYRISLCSNEFEPTYKYHVSLQRGCLFRSHELSLQTAKPDRLLVLHQYKVAGLQTLRV